MRKPSKYAMTADAPRRAACVHCVRPVGKGTVVRYRRANRVAHLRCAPRPEDRPAMETLILAAQAAP
jgi:hypothetical protein